MSPFSSQERVSETPWHQGSWKTNITAFNMGQQLCHPVRGQSQRVSLTSIHTAPSFSFGSPGVKACSWMHSHRVHTSHPLYTSEIQVPQLSNSATIHHRCWMNTSRRGMDPSHPISAIYTVGLLVWSTSTCGGWTWYRTGWDAGWRWQCCPLEKHQSERLIPLHFTHWKKPSNSDSKKKPVLFAHVNSDWGFL